MSNTTNIKTIISAHQTTVTNMSRAAARAFADTTDLLTHQKDEIKLWIEKNCRP